MSDQLDLYLLKTTDISSLNEYESLLSEKEITYYKEISSSKRKKEFVLSRYLTKSLLNIKPTADFKKNKNGKLYIDGGIVFNISHSHDYIICAISRCANVGVDLERADKKNSYIEISQKYFHELENKYIRSSADIIQQQLNFLQLWTLKESMFKMLGLGFSKDNAKLYFDVQNLKIISYPGYKDSRKVKAVLIDYGGVYISSSIELTTDSLQVNFQEVSMQGGVISYKLVNGSSYRLEVFT